MAWPTSIKTFVSGAVLYAADLNQQLRDALQVMVNEIVTTKGDLTPATGAKAIARLGVGADGTWLIGDASQSTGWRCGWPKTSAGTAVFAIDESGSADTLTLANGAIGNPFGAANNFSGLVLIKDPSWSGATALFLFGGASGVALVSQSLAGKFTVTHNNAGTINVSVTGGSVPRIQNNSGVTVALLVFALRMGNTL